MVGFDLHSIIHQDAFLLSPGDALLDAGSRTRDRPVARGEHVDTKLS